MVWPSHNSLLVERKLKTKRFAFFSSQFVCSTIYRFVQSVWLFSSRFTRFENLANQISRIPVIPKRNNFETKANCFSSFSSLFLYASVSTPLDKEFVIWPCKQNSFVKKRVYGPRKDFFYLYSDAQYSLKFPARVVPNPLFLPIYVIMTSFTQKWAKFLALSTFTLFILISLIVGPEFSNWVHPTSGT